MARAKAKAAALEAKAKAEEEERQRIVAERRAASAAYRRAKAQYILADLDKRMAAWRARPRRTRYGDDALCLPSRPGARGGARRGGRRGAGRRRRVARLDRRGGAARRRTSRRPPPPRKRGPRRPAPAAAPRPWRTPDALRDRAFRLSRDLDQFDAARHDGPRSWLGDRRTWRALAEAAAARGEPVLAVECYERGLALAYVSPLRRAQTDPERVAAYDRDDDVALLPRPGASTCCGTPRGRGGAPTPRSASTSGTRARGACRWRLTRRSSTARAPRRPRRTSCRRSSGAGACGGRRSGPA